MTGLVRVLSYVTNCGKSKMASVNRHAFTLSRIPQDCNELSTANLQLRGPGKGRTSVIVNTLRRQDVW